MPARTSRRASMSSGLDSIGEAEYPQRRSRFQRRNSTSATPQTRNSRIIDYSRFKAKAVALDPFFRKYRLRGRPTKKQPKEEKSTTDALQELRSSLEAELQNDTVTPIHFLIRKPRRAQAIKEEKISSYNVVVNARGKRTVQPRKLPERNLSELASKRSIKRTNSSDTLSGYSGSSEGARPLRRGRRADVLVEKAMVTDPGAVLEDERHAEEEIKFIQMSPDSPSRNSLDDWGSQAVHGFFSPSELKGGQENMAALAMLASIPGPPMTRAFSEDSAASFSTFADESVESGQKYDEKSLLDHDSTVGEAGASEELLLEHETTDSDDDEETILSVGEMSPDTVLAEIPSGGSTGKGPPLPEQSQLPPRMPPPRLSENPSPFATRRSIFEQQATRVAPPKVVYSSTYQGEGKSVYTSPFHEKRDSMYSSPLHKSRSLLTEDEILNENPGRIPYTSSSPRPDISQLTGEKQLSKEMDLVRSRLRKVQVPFGREDSLQETKTTKASVSPAQVSRKEPLKSNPSSSVAPEPRKSKVSAISPPKTFSRSGSTADDSETPKASNAMEGTPNSLVRARKRLGTTAVPLQSPGRTPSVLNGARRSGTGVSVDEGGKKGEKVRIRVRVVKQDESLRPALVRSQSEERLAVSNHDNPASNHSNEKGASSGNAGHRKASGSGNINGRSSSAGRSGSKNREIGKEIAKFMQGKVAERRASLSTENHPTPTETSKKKIYVKMKSEVEQKNGKISRVAQAPELETDEGTRELPAKKIKTQKSGDAKKYGSTSKLPSAPLQGTDDESNEISGKKVTAQKPKSAKKKGKKSKSPPTPVLNTKDGSDDVPAKKTRKSSGVKKNGKTRKLPRAAILDAEDASGDFSATNTTEKAGFMQVPPMKRQNSSKSSPPSLFLADVPYKNVSPSKPLPTVRASSDTATLGKLKSPRNAISTQAPPGTLSEAPVDPKTFQNGRSSSEPIKRVGFTYRSHAGLLATPEANKDSVGLALDLALPLAVEDSSWDAGKSPKSLRRNSARIQSMIDQLGFENRVSS